MKRKGIGVPFRCVDGSRFHVDKTMEVERIMVKYAPTGTMLSMNKPKYKLSITPKKGNDINE